MAMAKGKRTVSRRKKAAPTLSEAERHERQLIHDLWLKSRYEWLTGIRPMGPPLPAPIPPPPATQPTRDSKGQDKGGRPTNSTTERAIDLLAPFPELRGKAKAAIAKLRELDPVSFSPSMTTDDDTNLWRRVRRAQLRRRIP